jgi:hypothetical protein
VVFLDDWNWSAFLQLAPALRRAGVRTVRVSTAGLRRTRVCSWLLFDRYEIASDGLGHAQLREILAGETIVDIQYSEALANSVRWATGSLSPELAERLGKRLDLVDKLAASQLFAAAGIRTPATASVCDVSPQEIAVKFGFPVVVKPKVGCGGANVTIAHDLDELVTAASVDNPEDFFFEEFITGTKFDYAAAVSPTAVEQEIAYRVLQWQRPVGRATEVETIEDPRLVAFGRRVIGVSGCTGLVNMDVMRDEHGDDWLIDFNPRAFGASGNFRAAGINTSQGYLRSIGQRSDPPTRTSPVIGQRINVFPTTLEDLVKSGSIVRTTAVFTRQSLPFIKWLGFRYWLSEALSTAMTLFSTRTKRSRVGRQSLSPRRLEEANV